MTFGNRLRRLREERELTQIDLAKVLSLGNSTISQYEADRRTPDSTVIQKIASYFDVSTDYLLGRTDDPRTVEQISRDNAERISEALTNDPDSADLVEFWNEMKEREDLFLLFKQVRPLSDDSIRRVIRIIKAIEDEESGQHDF